MTERDRIPPLGELKATRRDVRDRPPPAPERPPVSADGYREYDLLLSASPPRALSIFQQSLAVLVRLLGLSILVIGIGATAIILREAWTLYQAPEHIDRFALAIEKGSNLDKIFTLSGGQAEEAGTESVETTASAGFRLSYFAGWFLVLLLMLIGSVVAISAISVGGRLVLYDTDIRRLSRAVVKEVRRRK